MNPTDYQPSRSSRLLLVLACAGALSAVQSLEIAAPPGVARPAADPHRDRAVNEQRMERAVALAATADASADTTLPSRPSAR